ncbi:unnamed protein product [Meloidogyne enterolobii]|uniref:Uncharacterized protein n=1 Tax=Meloidogyne enterolobii TaxID=390850 RepID=A0ACB0ZQI4_MELEN
MILGSQARDDFREYLGIFLNYLGAGSAMALKLSLFYDIKSPNSWIFFKVLRQKIPEWMKYRQISIEYFPVNCTFLHREICRFVYF